MWTIRTHYEILGVDPDAPTPQIRDAYRRAAREHHPDAPGGDAARMAAVNEAWRVLGDRASRREYDLTLAKGPVRTPDGDVPIWQSVEPRWNPLARYQNPPRFPWRLMGVMAALGTVAVLVSVATESPPPPATIDNVLVPGDCVAIEPNGDAAERLCTGPHDGVVVVFLAGEGRCPDGSEPHRDRQGLGTACVGPG